MVVKLAILQCCDTGPLESLVVMLRSAGIKCALPSEALKRQLRDLGCDTVLDIARRFRQEAIFEIDPDEVRVIACFDDRAAARPRGLLLR